MQTSPDVSLRQISLDFTDWVNLAWGSPLAGNGFQYWLRDHLFLIAAFILEDVAVTAYQVSVSGHPKTKRCCTLSNEWLLESTVG